MSIENPAVPADLRLFVPRPIGHAPGGPDGAGISPHWAHQPQDEIVLSSSFHGPQNPFMPAQHVAVAADADLVVHGNATGWSFGFIQFIRFQVIDVLYRGLVPANGEIFVQYYADAEQALLNTDHPPGANPSLPWYHGSTYLTIGTGTPQNHVLHFVDNPVKSIHILRGNHRTQIDNVVSRLWYRFQFTTVFAARHPDGAMYAMQSFDWLLDFNFDLTWDSEPPFDWHMTRNDSQGRVVTPPLGSNLERYPQIHQRFAGHSTPMPPFIPPRNQPVVIRESPTYTLS